MSNLQTIPFKDKQGEEKTLKDFQAKATLVVNVASKCGLTPQYTGLQALYEKYHAQGLEIMGFPANEFLAQEPGSNEEIQSFCSLNYGVGFPIHQKIVVKGEGQHPLYKALTEGQPEAIKNENGQFETLLSSKGLITGEPHEIHWNFEKFLLNAEGQIVARFFPDITAKDERVISQIEALLAA
ncbi:glutathione peroxidase [bacterium (Candidatus Blackallbacteria) CG17_big_fil_post_rev_8_21_14_2_50_48_46]|uniref:Glutathione peroxidase n=1 Tax=bacterium (Candidatus Blackallbacteria) CG17_big_fil_post_rev_8_21_14_2_50_48_46 TaxID=2014261 RepID=A0A2M7G0R5_9BACT|nr:MAG: glutathione peroxidase [bacterium (Candidatus Blackallbacteria) CG18_big_fil_WC_8_21_14_2_50_49_26]PIW15269.1 MAG: glutathione peroxidase [bacterium (Candidatus Blackallbacteria) CG17_big_fil_post_rev_8_21_14_2_50_48_46]PIW45222.1 MAG: glutathione peroxidase [bacterium (Candidatus Blackallbacteria) CG13_big_fil_rev_8_21_14_2_50_49_14]